MSPFGRNLGLLTFALLLLVILINISNTLALFKISSCPNDLLNKRHPKNMTNHSHHPSNFRLNSNIITNGTEIYRLDLLKSVDRFFYKPDGYNLNLTLSDFIQLALTTKAQVSFNEQPIHRYDGIDESKLSNCDQTFTGSQDICIHHLEDLNKRAQRQYNDRYRSKDLNFHQLIDTFGRAPAGVLLVNTFWPGMYKECLRLKITSNKNENKKLQDSVGTRYCVASFKYENWKKSETSSDYLILKAGICLPIFCDSSDYKKKYQLIQQLMDFNSRAFDLGQVNLTDLYCLPDDDSPYRTWWYFEKVNLIIFLSALWIAVLIYSTYKYEKLSKSRNTFEDQQSKILDKSVERQIFKSLSLISNFRLLFDMETGEKFTLDTSNSDAKRRGIINLRCLDGIKVLCMFYVIAGHILICLLKVVINVRELTEIRLSNILYIISNITPNNAVDVFLVITGLLTTYFLFKKKQAHSFILNPVKWIIFIVYRYLRIMPTYMTVFIYMKYISKFTGSGPYWDYGTSSLTPRKMCEQESWWEILLFKANFKPVFQHCIPTGWYLANDVQFLIITPILLAILYWRPVIGKILLILCTVLGSIACCLSILNSDAPDLRTAFKFMPQTYLFVEVFMPEAYTWPQYRIPAYLIGILLGYSLYKYEQDKLEYLEEREAEQKHNQPLVRVFKLVKKEPDWPNAFKRFCPLLSIFFLMLNSFLPILGIILNLEDFGTSLTVASVWPASHIMVSLSIGFYVLLACTGHGNRTLNLILSASLWKPLAKLSLCVVLINFEVISYIIQTRTQPLYLDFSTHLSLILLCLLWIYLIAIIIHLTIEAPASIALNQIRLMLTSKDVVASESEKDLNTTKITCK